MPYPNLRDLDNYCQDNKVSKRIARIVELKDESDAITREKDELIKQVDDYDQINKELRYKLRTLEVGFAELEKFETEIRIILENLRLRRELYGAPKWT